MSTTVYIIGGTLNLFCAIWMFGLMIMQAYNRDIAMITLNAFGCAINLAAAINCLYQVTR